MKKAANEILASADELQVFELFKRIKIERFNGLAYSHFHNNL